MQHEVCLVILDNFSLQVVGNILKLERFYMKGCMYEIA